MLDWCITSWSNPFGPLLAEAESYRHLGRRFQQNAPPIDSEDLIWAATIVLGPLVLLGLFKFAQRLRRNFQTRRGESLFLELCRAHGLDWRSRLQLWGLVRELRLQPPAAIFLSSDRLAQAMRDERRPASEREEIRLLWQTLFGASATELSGRESAVGG
jgi:hypothetical protein